MGFFDSILKKRTDIVIAELKKLTERESYKLSFTPEENVGIFSSKLGGLPYWDKNEPYPVDSEGEAMPLLCQLNLKDIGAEGLLQFFISPGGKTQCSVVYRKNPDKSVTPADIEALGVPVMPKEGFSPVKAECAVSFEKAADYISVSDIHFNSLLKSTVKAKLGKTVKNDMYSFFTPEECEKICSALSGRGSKLFGYPCFVQDDFRDEKSDEQLLLQIDSDFESDNPPVMWGDSGEGNFFITQKALSEKDFSSVTYNWDCY